MTWTYPSTYTYTGSDFIALMNIAESNINSCTAAAASLSSLSLDDPTTLTDPSQNNSSDITFDTTDLLIPDSPTLYENLTNTEGLIGNKNQLDTLTMRDVVTDGLITDSITVLKKAIISRMGYDPDTGLAYTNAQFATGLSPVVEQALFNREKDRISTQSTSQQAEIIESAASMGWKRPTGKVVQAAINNIIKQREANIAEASRNITIAQANLEQSNLQRVFDQFTVLQSGWVNAKAGDETNKLEKFKAENNVDLDRIRTIIDINQLKISLFSADVQAYVANANIKQLEAKILLEKVSLLNQSNVNLATVAIEKAKMLNSFYLGKFQSNIEAKKAAGSIYSQIASTALNSIHIGTNISYSESESWHENHSIEG